MIELVTDLLGKTVEFRRFGDFPPDSISLSVRGTVRGAYVAANQPHLIVEARAGLMAEWDFEGELRTFSMSDGRVRVVEQCTKCLNWDAPHNLDGPFDIVAWVHRDGVGCKKPPARCQWTGATVFDCRYCQCRACLQHPEIEGMLKAIPVGIEHAGEQARAYDAIGKICKCNEAERHQPKAVTS